MTNETELLLEHIRTLPTQLPQTLLEATVGDNKYNRRMAISSFGLILLSVGYFIVGEATRRKLGKYEFKEEER